MSMFSQMPGLVKIGSTTLTPEVRARQLSSSMFRQHRVHSGREFYEITVEHTGVPRPFQVVAFHAFEDERRAERELHHCSRRSVIALAASVKTAEGLHIHAAASRSSVTRRRML
jgi:hypothetical protein